MWMKGPPVRPVSLIESKVSIGGEKEKEEESRSRKVYRRRRRKTQ